MPKKAQSLSPQKRGFPVRKFWLISLSIVLVAIGVSIGKSLYETYYDRPLAKGLDYIGRQYNSGCIPFRILCTGPETEYLYYATDIEPDKVLDLFPNWKLQEDKQKSNWEFPGEQAEEYVYNLISSDDTKLAGYVHFPDKNQVTRELHLLPTSKPYIIMVDRDEYETLRQVNSQ